MIELEHAGAWVTAPQKRPLGRGVIVQIGGASAASTAQALRAVGFSLFREPVEAWHEVDPSCEEGQVEVLAQDPDGYLMRFVQVLGPRAK